MQNLKFLTQSISTISNIPIHVLLDYTLYSHADIYSSY